MSKFYNNKLVVVTGSEGLIGKELCILLKKEGATVIETDIKNGFDLTYYTMCDAITYNIDYVFHLMGIKGSPKRTEEKPLDFFVPMVQANTNMIEAARKNKVKRFLYTSSIAVLNPETDFYPSWAKLTGEHQIEALRKQEPDGMKCCVVRPANVYGKFDNFNTEFPMVITALIKKALHPDSEHMWYRDATGKEYFGPSNMWEVWGDGTQQRDFVNAKDVARCMMICMEKMPQTPINIGSGELTSIEEIAEIIAKETKTKYYFNKAGPTGGQVRGMDIQETLKLGWKPKVKIKDGIKEVIKWKQKEKL